jgi:DNA gyrase subunit A
LSEYRIQSRGGKGVINIKTTDKNGKVIAVMPVTKESEILIITSQGKLIRLEAEKIRATGRSAQGVKLIDTSSGDLAVGASLVERQSGQLAEVLEAS